MRVELKVFGSQCSTYSTGYKFVAMCLAIPRKVEEIINEGDPRVGRANFGGAVKRVWLE
jgi:hypothetical protein